MLVLVSNSEQAKNKQAGQHPYTAATAAPLRQTQNCRKVGQTSSACAYRERSHLALLRCRPYVETDTDRIRVSDER